MALENPYSAPQAEIDGPATAPLKRGIWLTLFMVYVTITSLSSPLVFAFAWETMMSIYPKWVAVSLATISSVRLLSVVGLWFWSRAGVVLYVVLSLAAISVSLAAGYKMAAIGLLGVVAVVLFFRKHWTHMPWLFANNSSKPTPLRGAA